MHIPFYRINDNHKSKEKHVDIRPFVVNNRFNRDNEKSIEQTICFEKFDLGNFFNGK